MKPATSNWAEAIPEAIPLPFSPFDIESEWIVHKGIISSDMTEYYFTISDKEFTQFDILQSRKVAGKWSTPVKASFNSAYNDHGMSFSPDGNTLWFSSTRLLDNEELAATWHIWKSELKDGKWSASTYVDIPNLRDKLTSHPTVSNNGTLYFHSSELDYSGMELYNSELKDGVYEDATPVFINPELKPSCTPFVSPNEDFLVFAKVNESLDLMIAFKDSTDKWSEIKTLSDQVNTNGQGNPFVTSDGKFLLYTSEDSINGGWGVNWVNMDAVLEEFSGQGQR